jgi:hypothetical protein
MMSVALDSMLTEKFSTIDVGVAFLIDPQPISVAPFPSYNPGFRLGIGGKQMGLINGEYSTGSIPRTDTS